MFSWLHNFDPTPVLISLGPINLYWYGFFIVLGIITALSLALYLGKKNSINKNKIWDLAFYLVLFGIIGARIYEIFLELPYYLKNPLQIIKIWEGGLAIHGGIIAGVIVLIVFARKNQLSFWKLGAIFAPGIALGQAIGRFGNWFNQELFGLPTNLPWGIPIPLMKRPLEFISFEYFHPTFLYESLGSLLIAILLVIIIKRNNNLSDVLSQKVVLLYLFLYSWLRFLLEFIKVDRAPEFVGLRWPQIISLLIICLVVFIYQKRKNV